MWSGSGRTFFHPGFHFSPRALFPALAGVFISLTCVGCFAPHLSFLAGPAKGSNTYLLHLPGVSGEQWLDREMCRGLHEGGFDGPIQIYDWTVSDPGIDALLAHQRNLAEAQKIANLIETRYRVDPSARIVLMSHSGGAGVTVWALEKLPADVQVDTLLLLAPALSQKYDLTRALTHVRHNAYVFTNPGDVFVLGIGTSLFGTMDGVNEEAAGLRGFTRPDTADPVQYSKLVEFPYARDWQRFENMGDHVGCMSRPFAAKVLGPLITDRRAHAAAPASGSPSPQAPAQVAHRLPASRPTTEPIAQ